MIVSTQDMYPKPNLLARIRTIPVDKAPECIVKSDGTMMELMDDENLCLGIAKSKFDREYIVLGFIDNDFDVSHWTRTSAASADKLMARDTIRCYDAATQIDKIKGGVFAIPAWMVSTKTLNVGTVEGVELF